MRHPADTWDMTTSPRQAASLGTRARELVTRPSDRVVVAALWGLLLLWALASFAVGRDASAPNYNIYRSVAEWVNTTGGVPSAGQVLESGVNAVYADFTGPSLWIYRLLFLPIDPQFEKAAYLGYQAVAYGLAVWLIVFRRERLGLRPVHSRVLAALAASPMIAGASMLLLDDKAAILAGAVVVLAVTAPWWRAVALGVVAAWTGAALLAMPLLLVHARHRVALIPAVAGAAVFGVFTFSTGSATMTLFQNRLVREGGEPFAFSLWRLAGDGYGLARYVLLLGLVAIALLGVYRGMLQWPEAFVMLAATMMLMSTNTVPSRIGGVVILGVLVFRRTRARTAYLAGVTVWSLLMLGLALAQRTVGGAVLSGSIEVPWWQSAPLVVVVNAPLLLIVCVAAARLFRQPRRT